MTGSPDRPDATMAELLHDLQQAVNTARGTPTPPMGLPAARRVLTAAADPTTTLPDRATLARAVHRVLAALDQHP